MLIIFSPSPAFVLGPLRYQSVGVFRGMGKCLLKLMLLLFFLGWSEAETMGREVVVYTSEDKLFSEPVLKEFEKRSGIKVKAIYDTEEAKSTGIVNRLIAEKDNSQADVFWSGDPVRPLLLEKRNMLEPYKSPHARDIPEIYEDEDGQWTGFSARTRVLLYNKELVSGGEAPQSIFDLLTPRWKGQVAMANPLFGTTSIHVASLFCVLGEERAREFLEGLKANGVRTVSSNGEVKRLVSRGEVAVGLTDTDDARRALLEGKPVGIVYPDRGDLGTLVMPNMVCIIKGGPNPEEAEQLVDFLLSEEVEASLARAECAQVPLRTWVEVPEELRLDQLKPMLVDYREVARKLEDIYPYLKEWTGF